MLFFLLNGSWIIRALNWERYVCSLEYILCTCFWIRVSSHAWPVPMPILSRRYFFDHFVPLWFFTFTVPIRAEPPLTGGWGQKVSLPLEPPPPVFVHLLGNLMCHTENFTMVGRKLFDLCRFLCRHFVSDFDKKGQMFENSLKIVPCKLQNNNNQNTYNYLLYKLLSRIFKSSFFYLKMP